MKMQRFSLAALVVLGLVATGAAWGYVNENQEALNRVSQIVNLRGSSNTGEMNFSSLLRAMPDGTEVPFTIPTGRVLLITRFYYDLKSTSTESGVMVFLDPFLYPAAGGNPMVNGKASGLLTFASGCAIGPPTLASPLYRIRVVSSSMFTTIPGTLNVSINGFLLNPNVPMAPIFNLLMQ